MLAANILFNAFRWNIEQLLSICYRRYTSWREEGGKFQDGRHYKQFIVVDDETGAERVVVTAEDSHRRDR